MDSKNVIRGTRRWLLFAAGSASYFLVVSVLNHYIVFEGILGLCYAAVLVLYGLAALKDRPHVIVLLGMAWVLIIIINAYMVFAIMGIMTGRHLKELPASGGIIWTYSALAALVLKFAMGRVVLALYRRKDNAGQVEDGIMAGTFLLLFVMVLGMFGLEDCGLNQRGRHYLSLCLFRRVHRPGSAAGEGLPSNEQILQGKAGSGVPERKMEGAGGTGSQPVPYRERSEPPAP